MVELSKFYVDGRWVEPQTTERMPVINPATELPVASVHLGGAADVDQAVRAARAAFGSFSGTSQQVRMAMLERLMAAYQRRQEEMARLISTEMGAPIAMARQWQSATPLGLAQEALKVLSEYSFEVRWGTNIIRKEAIGVCGLITPWNWPMHQVFCKLLPALAAGCTVVLKPSEVAPMSAYLLAEIVHEADLPPGVFNLINGTGPTVGSALARHEDVDMVSFTGYPRAGVAVSQAAAETHKRVALELGGKSANIVLEDADLETAVVASMQMLLLNTGQNCNAPTRLLVPRKLHEEAVSIAAGVANGVKPGDPTDEATVLGPLATGAQFERVQSFIQSGLDEGARLAAGGLGKPKGRETGFFVRPTVFASVSNDMQIAREEIFGPVLSVIPYESEQEAVRIANDSKYGLSGCVSSRSHEHAVEVARQMRTGMVHINNAPPDLSVPFGGYKQSGNGREWGRYGMEEYLETKSMVGA